MRRIAEEIREMAPWSRRLMMSLPGPPHTVKRYNAKLSLQQQIMETSLLT